MPAASFCINCGSGLIETSKFCANCGHSVGRVIENESETIKTEEFPDSKKEEIHYFSWAGIIFAAVIGISAFFSVMSLPSDAGYVTFNLTVDNILNGGWYYWYTGSSALAMKFTVESGYEPNKSGMDASTFRWILWSVTSFSTAFCIGMAGPAFKNGLRKFIKDVTN